MKSLFSISILITIFFIATLLMILFFNVYKPRLLILHSYSDDYYWTRDVSTGIKRVLDNKFNYAIRWFYMNMNNHNEPKYRENTTQTVRNLIASWQPNVVLAVDDDAQEYVMKHYVDKANIQIVFAGINRDLTNYGYSQASNVTGIIKRNELNALKDFLLYNLELSHRDNLERSRTPDNIINKRERQKLISSEPNRKTNIDNGNKNCAVENNFLKLAPNWRNAINDGLTDCSMMLQIFNWSPIRLSNYSIEDNLFKSYSENLTRANQEPLLIPAPKEENVNSAPLKTIRIFNLGDASEIARNDEIFIRAFDWQPLRLVEARLVNNFDEWQVAIKSAANQADIIIINNYRQLMRSATEPTLVPSSEVINWTLANSALPTLGTIGQFVIDGGYLAISPSPFEQGEIAAQMLLKIIQQKTLAKDIPFALTNQFTVFMREKIKHTKGWRLPKYYESFARATNNYFD